MSNPMKDIIGQTCKICGIPCVGDYCSLHFYPYIWNWKSHLPERKGQRCRIVNTGKMNSALYEFEDGFQVVGSKFAVRRAK